MIGIIFLISSWRFITHSNNFLGTLEKPAFAGRQFFCAILNDRQIIKNEKTSFCFFNSYCVHLKLCSNPPGKKVYDVFRGTSVVNGHSVETLLEGEMEMIIGHRFGRLNGGAYELFGLDQANIRIGLDYGIKKYLNIGIGRSSLGKEFDGFIKLRIFNQGAKGERACQLL